MDIKKTGHTCETSPEACAQPYLLPHATLALFWMGRGAAILSSAQMTAEDLVFAVRGLGEAQAAYLQKLIEVCGACDALCECRAARVEETDALRRLPPKLLRELWEKGVCIRNLGRALASALPRFRMQTPFSHSSRSSFGGKRRSASVSSTRAARHSQSASHAPQTSISFCR